MRIRVALLVLVVAILTGCATPAPTPAEGPSVSPSPSIAALARPASVFATECADVLDPEILTRLYGVALEPMEPDAHYAYPEMSTAAIAQAGGLVCAWRQPGEAEADVVFAAGAGAAADFATVSAILMDGDGLAYGSDYHAAALFDGLVVRCDGYPEYDYLAPLCQWVALSGDIGVSLWMSRTSPDVVVDVAPPPNPDTSLPGVIPVIEGSDSVALLEGAFAALDAEPRRELEPLPTRTGGDCVSGLTAAEVADAFGVASAPEPRSDAPAFGPGYSIYGQRGGWITTASVREIGLVRCSVPVESSAAWPVSVTAWSIPGMAWLLAGDAAHEAEEHFGPIAGLGRDGVQSCGSGEDGNVCRVAFVEGDELRYLEVVDTARPVDPQAVVALAGVAFD